MPIPCWRTPGITPSGVLLSSQVWVFFFFSCYLYFQTRRIRQDQMKKIWRGVCPDWGGLDCWRRTAKETISEHHFCGQLQGHLRPHSPTLLRSQNYVRQPPTTQSQRTVAHKLWTHSPPPPNPQRHHRRSGTLVALEGRELFPRRRMECESAGFVLGEDGSDDRGRW